jgi:hypothetical protein
MTTPLVHIGYPKAGSSWLQAHVFVDDAVGFSPVTPGALEISRRLVYPHPLDFDADACRALFAPKMDEISSAGLVPVVTGERLSGAPHAGGYDSKEVAHRIKDVFQDAKVLIVIREQRSSIRSGYKQYVRAGGALSLDRYLEPSPKGFASFPAFDFAHYRYHRLVSLYQDLFGRESVLVLPFELLRSAPREFVERIVRFGIADPDLEALANLPYGKWENTAMTATTLPLRRRLNRFIVWSRFNPSGHFASSKPRHAMHRSFRPIERIIPSSVHRRLDQKMIDRIAELAGAQYQESNRWTSKLIDLDLEPFGYDVGG